MGTTPTTVDATAKFFNELVAAAISGGEKGLEAYLAVAAPILEGPIVGVLTNEVISLIGQAVYTNLANLATALVIDFQTNGEESKAYQAVTNLNAAKAAGDANAIAKASQDFDNALGGLIHSDGSAPA
jgi:hypothetical protein